MKVRIIFKDAAAEKEYDADNVYMKGEMLVLRVGDMLVKYPLMNISRYVTSTEMTIEVLVNISRCARNTGKNRGRSSLTKEERLKKMNDTAKSLSDLLTHSGLSPADCYRLTKRTEEMILNSIMTSIDLSVYGKDGIIEEKEL